MGQRMIKKLSIMFVCIAMLCTNILPVFASAEVMPCYNVVTYADAYASVSSDGELLIDMEYEVKSSITRAEITILVEKQTLVFFWSDIDEWSHTIYDSSYAGSDSMQLPKEGTYRVTVTFEVYGSDGTVDTITCEDKVEW